MTIDGVILFFVSGGEKTFQVTDLIAKFFYGLLPQIQKNNLAEILIYICLIYMLISILRGISMFISSNLTASSTENAIKRLRDTLFLHIQRLPLNYFNKIQTGELIQRCTGDVETIRKFASMQVVESLRMFVIFTTAFLMMLSINVQYALIAISTLPVILISSLYFFKKEGKVWNQHEKQQDLLTSMVQGNLSGIRVVQAFAREDFEIRKFTHLNIEKRKWGMKLIRLHSIYWPSSDFIVHFQIALSVFMGGYLIITGVISVGEYIAFYSYALMITWPLRRLAQLVSEMGMTTVAIDRVYSILDSKIEINTNTNVNSASLKGEIEFENVFFRYDDKSNYVLNDLSFIIKTGEKVAFMGPAGSGKSSIVSLLMKFYEPKSGVIKINGINTNNYTREFIRGKIGVVLQKPFLFSTSIRNNIAYSKPDIQTDAVIESARTAHIHEIIEDTFPDSYDTVVGEKGVTLSGGQKQRVTLARTLLKNPDILILDDTTSSVDIYTEYKIQKALDSAAEDKTTIVIAHRITSVKDCDRIFILEKGRITACGSHNELIQKDNFYSKVYNLQNIIEKEIYDEMKYSISDS